MTTDSTEKPDGTESTGISKQDQAQLAGILRERLQRPVGLDVWTRAESKLARTDRDNCEHCDELLQATRDLVSLHPDAQVVPQVHCWGQGDRSFPGHRLRAEDLDVWNGGGFDLLLLDGTVCGIGNQVLKSLFQEGSLAEIPLQHDHGSLASTEPRNAGPVHQPSIGDLLRFLQFLWISFDVDRTGSIVDGSLVKTDRWPPLDGVDLSKLSLGDLPAPQIPSSGD